MLRLPVWAVVVFCLAILMPASAGALTVEEIQGAIAYEGARWQAGDTEAFELSREKGAPGLGERMDGPAREAVPPSELPRPLRGRAGLPSHLDWRDRGGKNFVTPVRNQLWGGTCWAFAAVGMLESQELISRNIPGYDLDLSEQAVVSCSGAGNSATGGWSDEAGAYLAKGGAPLEGCFPYAAEDLPCGFVCDGSLSMSSAYVLQGSDAVEAEEGRSRVDIMREGLDEYGPMAVSYYVYEDFYAYTGGVYSHVTGERLGGHAVLLVGYDDEEQCFIVKNSWGPDWGEEGFFRIAYSQTENEVDFGKLMVVAYGAYSPKWRVVPVIRVMDRTHEVTVEAGAPVKVELTVPYASTPPTPVDWWCVWRTPDFELYSYVYPRGWVPGIHRMGLWPAKETPGMAVMDTMTMPVGENLLTFMIDSNGDGEPNGEFKDQMVVNIADPDEE